MRSVLAGGDDPPRSPREGMSGSGWRTGGTGLPAEVRVQARCKRLAVTHAITVNQIPIKSIGFIDKVRATGRAVPDRPGYQANGPAKFMPYIGRCKVTGLTWPRSYRSPCPPQYDITCSPDGLVHSGTQGGPA